MKNNIIVGSVVKYKTEIYFVNNITNNLVELLPIDSIDIFDTKSSANINQKLLIKTELSRVTIYEDY
jgi:hypothetical protein